MNRLIPKVFIALLAAIIGIGVIVYQQQTLRESFDEITNTNLKFQKLHTDIVTLQHTVLKASYFLYFNGDQVYKESETIEKELDAIIAELSKERSLFVQTLRNLQNVRRMFRSERKRIDTFLTFNASLKNSGIYLPTILRKAYHIFDVSKKSDREVVILLSKINSALFLAKNALDESFIEELANDKKRLEAIKSTLPEGPKLALTEASLRHLDIFVRYFPLFHRTLEDILDTSLIDAFEKSYESYGKEVAKETGTIETAGNLFLAIYLLSILIVIYFIFHSEHENIRLKKLHESLEKSLLTDPLTGLPNRAAYRMDKKRYRQPALMLFNIDRFKHINDFYGTDTGDAVLKECAKRLTAVLPILRNARLYRLGGDDFGILFEFDNTEASRKAFKTALKKALTGCTEHPFDLDSLMIDISVSAGVSTQKERLFETADMALKFAKSSSRHLYAIFDASMDQTQTIKKNIHAISQLKTALANDRLFPYFQPIVDLSSGRTIKYEALARIRDDQGSILSPWSFLEAAKQAKLSGTVTAVILEKTLQTARETKGRFSVNVSASDIMSSHDRNQICRLLHTYSDVASHITFEVLEGEEIEDYEIIDDFFRGVRRHGCQIAIDDFGSGYSNFEKLLQLDIDTLKIDGSLIKNVDHDAHAELVVKTMIAFAKGADIKTVAEFVHSEAVLQKVTSLGIDFGQGYHLGKPMPADFYFGRHANQPKEHA
jgi:diguanylate cyclase (GGDEF)-like protein